MRVYIESPGDIGQLPAAERNQVKVCNVEANRATNLHGYKFVLSELW